MRAKYNVIIIPPLHWRPWPVATVHRPVAYQQHKAHPSVNACVDEFEVHRSHKAHPNSSPSTTQSTPIGECMGRSRWIIYLGSGCRHQPVHLTRYSGSRNGCHVVHLLLLPLAGPQSTAPILQSFVVQLLLLVLLGFWCRAIRWQSHGSINSSPFITQSISMGIYWWIHVSIKINHIFDLWLNSILDHRSELYNWSPPRRNPMWVPTSIPWRAGSA